MSTPTEKQIAKLPKWARTYISTMQDIINTKLADHERRLNTLHNRLITERQKLANSLGDNP